MLKRFQSRLKRMPNAYQVLSYVWLQVRLMQGKPNFYDQGVMSRQLHSLLKRETDIPLPPPKHLQIRVAGAYSADFTEFGYRACEDLDCALKPAGKRLTDFKTILDFGCGCGRLIRPLKAVHPAGDLHGGDIDPEAIEWLQNNYARFARYTVFPHRPPTGFSDAMFDLIIGISVFTHLPEEMQFAWLRELNRIAKPGGYLVLTTLGEKLWSEASSKVRRAMREKGFYYGREGYNYGSSVSLPDFYQKTYHAQDYIRREWGRYFEVIDILPSRLNDQQDIILLRKSSV